MTKIFKRKQLVIASLVVALAAAVFANWYYTNGKGAEDGSSPLVTQTSGEVSDNTLGEARLVNSPETSAPAEENSGDYFASVKLNRNAAHDMALENIKAVMASVSDSAEIDEAENSLDELSRNIKLESDIETLVSAKTGSECVAVINNDAIEVVVAASAIDDSSVMQIRDIVVSNSDIPSENIKIIGAK